jgi:hypothetical protein
LLHCDPENTAPAEEAFCSAIDIAQRQETKSLELRAALALAKLYQASNRTADAQAVLGPAIENFRQRRNFRRSRRRERYSGRLRRQLTQLMTSEIDTQATSFNTRSSRKANVT